MLTCCPQCETTFRVTPEQLKARQGKVRCGECNAVFNALDTLLEEIPAAAAETPEPTQVGVAEAAAAPPEPPYEEPSGAADDPAELSSGATHDFDPGVPVDTPSPPDTDEFAIAHEWTADEVAPTIEPVFEEHVAITAEVADETVTEAPPELPSQRSEENVEPDMPPESALAAAPFASEPEVPEVPAASEPAPGHGLDPSPAPGPGISAEVASSLLPEPSSSVPPQADTHSDPAVSAEPAPVAAVVPDYIPELHKRSVPPRARWPWVLGTLVALTALLAQLAIGLRTEAAILYPQAKPLLAALCDVAGCQLSLPRKVDLVGIESSDLHPGSGNGKLLLVAALRNRAPFIQEYPHLELTLTDAADDPLARRVIAPADYLPTRLAAGAGFAANADLALNLSVAAEGLAAAGYRLYLFYP